MTRPWKAVIVLMVAALGLWGCSRSSAPQWSAHTERIRSLEAKCVKLEDEYRGVVSTRDQLRKHIASLEEENVRLDRLRQQLNRDVAQARSVQQECDQLRRAMESRTTERDALQARCERLKKGLQSLIGQDDASTSVPGSVNPVSATTEPMLSGQS